MAKAITLFFIYFQILVTGHVSGQVMVQDSLALVSLYNSTNGNNWINKQNWLNSNVSSWYGVFVTSGRVTTLSLSNNNLQGTLPGDFCNLTALRYMYFSNNQISGTFPSCFESMMDINSIDVRNNQMTGPIPTGIVLFPMLADVRVSGNQFTDMPSLLSVPEISNVSMENNQFTFEDIESNLGILNFSYVPQDSVLSYEELQVEINDTVTLNTLIGGVSNIYQWKKNGLVLNDIGTHLVGTSNAFLTINKLTLDDSGDYHAVITSSNVLSLVLQRRIIRLNVIDTRVSQFINFQPGDDIFCGDGPIKLIANNSSGLPLQFMIVSGNASINFDTITPLSSGMIHIRVSHAGDDFYKPVTKDTIIQVLPTTPADLFIVTSNSPVTFGDSLILSVNDVTGYSFIWSKNQVSIGYDHRYLIPHAQNSDSGLYYVDIYKNGCRVYGDSAFIEVLEKPTLKYYQLMTPNGDGKNDFFYIENVELYPNNRLTVFNSLNQILYRGDSYQNDWSGSNLPTGTYYFVFEADEIFIKGSIYLRR